MAIDTRNRRASMMGLGLTALLVLPTSDGTIEASDRQHFLGLYSGLALAPPEPSAPSRVLADISAAGVIVRRITGSVEAVRRITGGVEILS
jgi:hypothetical protein